MDPVSATPKRPPFDAIARLTPIDKDLYQGVLPAAGWKRPFGGYLLAQLYSAASATVEPGRPGHAIQTQFVRAGNPSKPILYEVFRHIDGRRFSSRRVTATQSGVVLAEALVSHQEEEAGLEYQPRTNLMPGPEGLRCEADLRAEIHVRTDIEWAISPLFAEIPVELRPVQQRNFVDPSPQPPKLDFWLRPTEPISASDGRALVACLSDTMLLSSTLLPHGLSWMTTPIEGLTLNHSLWIHREPPLDDWLLWSIEGLWTGGTRGLARASLWSRDGILIANAVQEGLIRLR